MPAAITTDERTRALKLAHKSLENFGRIFLARAMTAKTPPMHAKIDRLLMDPTCKRKGIIAPRGHAKSTKASVILPLYSTLFNHPDTEKLYIGISESQSQSIAFLNIIGWNLANNEKIKACFGNLVGNKWREDELSTTNNVRLLARGTGQRIRGSISGREGVTRPNRITLDDFESETNSGTPEAIDKNKQWIARAVEPSLADDGELVAIGTMINQRAYLAEIQCDPAWSVLYFQALMNETCDGPGNIPVWPERFSYKLLMDKKASYEKRGQGSAFWQEYMNICIDMERQTFRAEWINPFYQEFEIIDDIQPVLIEERDDGTWCIPLHISIGVDLAISEAHYADYTVILVLAQAPDERRFVLDYWRERTGDTDKIVNEIFRLAYDYKADIVNIETVQFQQAVANHFYKQMSERNFYVGLEETKPRTSKDARIKSLQPNYALGLMHHRTWMSDLNTELETYPNSAHKDLLDALYLAEMHTQVPSFGEFKKGSTSIDQLRGIPEEREVADWLVL